MEASGAGVGGGAGSVCACPILLPCSVGGTTPSLVPAVFWHHPHLLSRLRSLLLDLGQDSIGSQGCHLHIGLLSPQPNHPLTSRRSLQSLSAALPASCCGPDLLLMDQESASEWGVSSFAWSRPALNNTQRLGGGMHFIKEESTDVDLAAYHTSDFQPIGRGLFL